MEIVHIDGTSTVVDIGTLLTWCKKHNEGNTLGHNAVLESIAEKRTDSHVWVIKKDNIIVAVGGFKLTHPGYDSSFTIVNMSHRGLGFAKILMKAKEEFLKSNGMYDLVIVTAEHNFSMRMLAQSMGYKFVTTCQGRNRCLVVYHKRV